MTLRQVEHTHSKFYVFDERILITGSINIEDRHRGYRDYMVEVCGEEEVGRFRDRLAWGVAYDPSRPIDFLVNADRRFEIKPALIDLLGRSRERLYIEMAYIGDPDISRAIIDASRRGVEVVILFSRAANIGNDINYRTLQQIWKDCELKVFLSDKMIHSKLMLFDDETVVLGSANLSVFSMQKAVELDLIVRGIPAFLEAVRFGRCSTRRRGRKRWRDARISRDTIGRSPRCNSSTRRPLASQNISPANGPAILRPRGEDRFTASICIQQVDAFSEASAGH